MSHCTAGVKNSALKYDWAVAPTLGDKALYGLVFTSEQDSKIFQFSNPFHIAAATNNASTTTVTTAVGTKTVSLSLAPTDSTTLPPSNLSTTSTGPAKTTVTTVVPATTTRASTTTASTGGVGAQATAGSLLGLAGFALAALAL